MTEEQAPTENTQIRVESMTEESIGDSVALRLVVEGPNDVVMATAEIALAFLQEAFGGEITRMVDGEGNDLAFAPAVVDHLSTGDDSVE